MTLALDRPDLAAVAAEIFEVLGTGRQVAPISDRLPGFGLPEAYHVAALVRQRREARGERVVGRKIGFTNRTIWDEYGVHMPIWGHVYDTTLHELAGLGEPFPLDRLAEPRIEPEIVFGIGRTPEPGMDDAALLGCVDWVAHGFEIVQSIYPGWVFSAPDTVAAFGLHGALLLGPRHPVSGRSEAWLGTLAAFEIEIFRDGMAIDNGRAANVLDGPLSALRHLVGLLGSEPEQQPLAPGEVVTTGTLTRAFPVTAGETWSTRLSGLALPGNTLDFA